MQLSVVNERKSKVKENKSYQIIFGGDRYGLQTTLDSAGPGDLVMMRQRSTLPSKRTYEHDIIHKSLLGIYADHAEIDLLEIKAIKYQAEQGLKPKNDIDI